MRAKLFTSRALDPEIAEHSRVHPNLNVEFSLRWHRLSRAKVFFSFLILMSPSKESHYLSNAQSQALPNR